MRSRPRSASRAIAAVLVAVVCIGTIAAAGVPAWSFAPARHVRAVAPGAASGTASTTATAPTPTASTTTTTAAAREAARLAATTSTTSTTSTTTPVHDPSSRAAAVADVKAAAAGSALVGTFRVTAGSCASGVTGSYFRMLQPGGTPTGPDSGYLVNANSTCANQTYTLFSPGSDGGLITGGYQPEPNPGFDGSGNSLANRIVPPATFFGVKFSVSTASPDPQTGTSVPAPSITTTGAGALAGDLRAFGASWNNGHFNQGTPKPDGTTPGLTNGPTGTYNPSSNAYTLTWTSQIVAGPFNGFTGQWHLTGTFVAGAASAGGVGTTVSGSDTGSRSGSGSASAGTSGSSSGLAFTGAGTTPELLAGTAMLVLGAALVAAAGRLTRRRLVHDPMTLTIQDACRSLAHDGARAPHLLRVGNRSTPSRSERIRRSDSLAAALRQRWSALR